MKIAILHPELAIGGRERLIIDTATLLSKTHNITLLTTSINPKFFTKELNKNNNLNLINFNYIGLPKFLSFSWLIVYTFRSLYLFIRLFYYRHQFDIIFMDVDMFLLPFLKFWGNKIIYYCHFPPYVKFKEKRNILRKIHNFITYYLVQFCYYFADEILVNSKYTQTSFIEMTPYLNITPKILYPCIINKTDTKTEYNSKLENIINKIEENNINIIMSINRIHPDKNLDLAIDTYYICKKEIENLKLLIVGGFDPSWQNWLIKFIKNIENKGLKVTNFPDFEGNVIFYKNFDDSLKDLLFKISKCVLYTPLKEHFGIGIIEAMVSKVPVIAVNQGGPLEIIVNNETGMLVEPNPSSFSDAVIKIFKNEKFRNKLKSQGYLRVKSMFTDKQYCSSLLRIIDEVKNKPVEKNNFIRNNFFVGMLVFVIIGCVCRFKKLVY